MARPVLGRVSTTDRARPAAGHPARVAHLDRDRALVEEARRDPLRFDALYRRYLAQVYSYAFYELGDHHEAEDATERTFLAALAGLPGFEERARPADGEGASTFRVWLFQIARNSVSNQRRSRRRHPAAPIEAAALVADPMDVEGNVALRDEAAAAWRAVGRLPADRRQALILRFVDEMSTAEIAGVLGKSEGAVRVLVHRALRAVARDLARRTRPMSLVDRDGTSADALLTDLYLDAILAGAALGAGRAVRPTIRRRGLDPRRPGGRGPAPPRPRPRPPLVPLRGAARDAARRGGHRDASPDGRRGRGAGGPVPAAAVLDPLAGDPTAADAAGGPNDPRGAGPAAADRRCAHLGGDVDRRGRARRLAARPARPDADGPGRAGGTRGATGTPGEARLTCRSSCRRSAPPRRLPAGPLDEVPVVRRDAVQQAARQGPPRLPVLRPPLPAVGRGPPGPAAWTTARSSSATPG